MEWYYERIRDDGDIERVGKYTNDLTGRITGRIVVGAKAWLDENPEERIRLGFTKHITHDKEEVKELWPYNSQTQYLMKSVVQVDDHTVEDVYHVIDKSEEQMLIEEINESQGGSVLIGGSVILLD